MYIMICIMSHVNLSSIPLLFTAHYYNIALCIHYIYIYICDNNYYSCCNIFELRGNDRLHINTRWKLFSSCLTMSPCHRNSSYDLPLASRDHPPFFLLYNHLLSRESWCGFHGGVRRAKCSRNLIYCHGREERGQFMEMGLLPRMFALYWVRAQRHTNAYYLLSQQQTLVLFNSVRDFVFKWYFTYQYP